MVQQSYKLVCRGLIKIHLGLWSKVKPRDEACTLGDTSSCNGHKQQSTVGTALARSRITRKIAVKLGKITATK